MDRSGAGLSQIFLEGGWGMYPVLVLGLVLLVSAALYARDREPARLRFLTVLALAELTFTALALVGNVAAVLWYVEDPERAPTENLWRIVFAGLKEASRPAGLGLLLLGVSLVLISVGVYRAARRELLAARGA
jgi:hypothetical protein